MKEMIHWLKNVEHLASRVYFQAAEVFSDDPELKDFLEHAARDEAWHHNIMVNAEKYISSQPDTIPVISVDQETSNKILRYLSEIQVGLDQQTISRIELIEKIVTLELTEWNDIFLYVVSYLQDEDKEFKYQAQQIQTHIKEIEHYLEHIENRPDILQKLQALPSIWSENILIVDDEEMITDLLRSLLNSSGNIDVAHNGQDALNFINNTYYKLIISDIDMPVMDGLTLFKTAIQKFPILHDRFIFMTGDLTSDRASFFIQNRIKYLTKPMEISVLKQEAEKILRFNQTQ